MFYAVIDTNVIVSSLFTKNRDAATVKIMEKVFDGTIKPVLHKKIISEYEEVLSRKEFPFTKEAIETVINAIKDNALYFNGIPADEHVNDPKDVIFYEVTLDARQYSETYLVTGNIKDFPIRPFIVTPREMLDIIEKNS